MDEEGPAGGPRRFRVEIVAVIVLLVADLVLGAFLSYLAVVLVFAYDSCAMQECSYNGFMAGWLLALIAPVIVLVVTGTATIVRVVRRKRAWWLPLVGAALAVGLWWGGAQIVFWAVPGSSF